MKRRKGFSLLTVLILGLISMAIVGAALGTVDRFSGAGRVTNHSGDVYNILQSEIERARATLKAEMLSRKDAVRCGPFGTGFIRSIEDIEVLKDDAPFWRVDDDNKRVGGMTGKVRVRIYDLRYSPKSVDPDATDEDMAELPLSAVDLLRGTTAGDDGPIQSGTSSGGASGAGVYLIRATVTFANGDCNKIDVALIQNSNPGA